MIMCDGGAGTKIAIVAHASVEAASSTASATPVQVFDLTRIYDANRPRTTSGKQVKISEFWY